MADRYVCVQCGAPDGVVVFRRRRDGAWFDAQRRAWCDYTRGARPIDASAPTDNPEWLESVGRARRVRTVVHLDGLCGVCAKQLERIKGMGGAA